MTCFFMVVFSIPFFIPSTYKAYLSELQPFCNMFDKLETDKLMYKKALENFVAIQKVQEDYLVRIETPFFTYEDPDYTNGLIRTIELIKMNFNDGKYKFIYNFKNTVSIYAGSEILAFVCILILLIAFVLIINADVVKFVVFPLE